jgi:hypothetical protein
MNDMTDMIAPSLTHVLTASVDIGPIVRMGSGPGGERRLVPILGGYFEGSRLRGRVLPGADRQLLADSESKTMDAVYELETHDGTLLTVRNRVKVNLKADPRVPPVSSIEITAPYGEYAWLNHAILVGRLMPPTAAQPMVRVMMYEVLNLQQDRED